MPLYFVLSILLVIWGKGNLAVFCTKNCPKKVNMSYSRAGRQLGQEFSLLKIKFSFIIYAL